ncbi:hypothetical protein AMECASPLE_034049 [Ameca splendens]|uniref:Uncharacterized protein n=1 Tax=Ameca splendens TaxID=208324 RepID=A0ABV0XKA5_9TELE
MNNSKLIKRFDRQEYAGVLLSPLLRLTAAVTRVPELLTFQGGAESRGNDALICSGMPVCWHHDPSRLCSSVQFGFLHLFFYGGECE